MIVIILREGMKIRVGHMKCYSVIKRNAVVINAITWMNLENIMLSERSSTQRATYYVIQFIQNAKIGKFIRTESRLVFVRAMGNLGDDS